METWDALRSRRNVRAYTDQPIPGDQLDRVLEAGRRSPSAANWQPWDFVVVTDRSALELLSAAAPGARHLLRAAAVIALGQTAMSIMLAAADLGVGTAHAAVEDESAARLVLGHPNDHFCPYLIAL